MKKSISSIDRQLMLEEAGQHQSVCPAREVKWLWVWEAARDRGQFWMNISDVVVCAPEDTSFFTHLSQDHTPSSVNIENLLVNLSS